MLLAPIGRNLKYRSTGVEQAPLGLEDEALVVGELVAHRKRVYR